MLTYRQLGRIIADRLMNMKDNITSLPTENVWTAKTNHAWDICLLFECGITNLYVSFSSLKSYVEVNYSGFRKSLKKYVPSALLPIKSSDLAIGMTKSRITRCVAPATVGTHHTHPHPWQHFFRTPTVLQTNFAYKKNWSVRPSLLKFNYLTPISNTPYHLGLFDGANGWGMWSKRSTLGVLLGHTRCSSNVFPGLHF